MKFTSYVLSSNQGFEVIADGLEVSTVRRRPLTHLSNTFQIRLHVITRSGSIQYHDSLIHDKGVKCDWQSDIRRLSQCGNGLGPEKRRVSGQSPERLVHDTVFSAEGA
jgi:hypothetical protein